MSEEAALRTLLDDAHEQLETAPTLVDLVRNLDVTRILQKQDYKCFERREYDPEPIARALLCRELGSFSWKGLYEYLSMDAHAIRLGSLTQQNSGSTTQLPPGRHSLTRGTWYSRMPRNGRSSR